MIPLGEWLPDQPALDNPGATVAKNVTPAARGYRAVKDLAYIDNTGTGAALTGAYAAKTPSASFLFAGSAAALWRYDSATADYDDVSNGSATYTSATWRFTSFGNDVIAVGGDQTDTQVFNLTSSSAFADLSGTPPRGRFVTTVRDFVMMGYVTYGGTTYPRRVRWSAVDSDTSWTIGTSLADYQDLADSGVITGLFGGEEATILLERGIYKGYFTGDPNTVWQFDRISVDRGCPYAGSAAQIGNAIFFLSDDGFYQLVGAQLTPIGDEKVDEWFADMFDVDKRANLTCAVDPIRKLVCWAFTSTDSTDGENDLILFYHYALKRWSYAALAADLLFPLYQPGFTLEGLDAISSSIDALEISLDDPSLAGGEFAFAAGIADRIATFSGQPLNGIVETAEQGAPQNTLVRRVYPMTTGAASGDVAVSIASRQSQQDSPTYGSTATMTDAGWCPTRAAGRYHRVRLSLTGETWDQINGIDVDVVPLGFR